MDSKRSSWELNAKTASMWQTMNSTYAFSVLLDHDCMFLMRINNICLVPSFPSVQSVLHIQGPVLPLKRILLCRLQDSLQDFLYDYTEKIPYGKSAFLLLSSLQKVSSYKGCKYGSSIFPLRHLNIISH